MFLQLTQFISPRSKFPRWFYYLPTNEIEAENAISIRDTRTLPAEPMTRNWMEEINSTQSLDFDTIKLIQAGMLLVLALIKTSKSMSPANLRVVDTVKITLILVKSNKTGREITSTKSR